MGLFLVSASPENIEKSIKKKVPLAAVKEYLAQDQLERLKKSLSGKESFNCWALTDSSSTTYDNMEVDDIVLFTVSGTGQFNFSGIVISKFKSESFGNSLWPIQKGKPWKLVYVLDKVRSLDIDKKALLRELGYAEKDPVQKPRKVPHEYLVPALRRYKTVENLIASLNRQA